MAIPLGHDLSNLPELLKKLTENSSALRPMKTQATLRIVINLTGRQATQHPPGTMIRFMGGQLQMSGASIGLCGTLRAFRTSSDRDRFSFVASTANCCSDLFHWKSDRRLSIPDESADTGRYPARGPLTCDVLIAKRSCDFLNGLQLC